MDVYKSRRIPHKEAGNVVISKKLIVTLLSTLACPLTALQLNKPLIIL